MPLATPALSPAIRRGAVLLLAAALAWSTSAPARDDSELPPDTANFELQAADGRTVSAEDFRGRYLLMFFGYTNCPDVCPSTMAATAAALRQLGERAERVKPLFISVDTRRDTPQALAAYTQAFHPDILGLTGDKRAINQAARSLGAMYRTMDYQGKYLVDHTASLYLVGPDGELQDVYPHGLSAGELARRLEQAMAGGSTDTATEES
ncbi:MAG TPA: SCO family protein [Pseudohaliea sp.]|nr:SCO family protein [Pseudohaliea sp.]